ncbi:MAG: AhpC/TSA family [Blastocatellia bacterium]|nr:AhpC/TSA family [Blastocatellia bacterium]
MDSDGNRILSNQTAKRVAIVAFFDPDSVLAWRTLSELAKKCQSQKNADIFLIGVASSRIDPAGVVNINTVKKQYQISFPIIPDQDKRVSQIFQAPSCCDYLETFDEQGFLKNSMSLSDSYDKLDSLIAELMTAKPANVSQLSGPEILSGIKIIDKSGAFEPLPIANQGLTVVNLFDEFCTDCVTGSRFQTMARLNRSRRPTTYIFIIFSKEHFSTEDLENFKAILSTDSLLQGDIETAKSYLISGKLLVVFDSNRNLIWQETAGMTEKEVLADVTRLLQSSTN